MVTKLSAVITFIASILLLLHVHTDFNTKFFKIFNTLKKIQPDIDFLSEEIEFTQTVNYTNLSFTTCNNSFYSINVSQVLTSSGSNNF